MPLYLDDAVPPPMPRAFLDVLLDCHKSFGTEAVNPAMVIGLLRERLLPLLPDVHKSLFDLRGQTSWDSLWILYANLATASGGTDKQLMASAAVVSIFVRHTIRPPREVDFPAYLELASFARMADLLDLPKAHPHVGAQEVATPLYAFCRYCWLPQRSRGVCEFHSTKSTSRNKEGAPLCAVATHKQVQRLRPAFEKELSRLVSAEEWQFHESEFGLAVMVPPSGLGYWLKERRPALWQQLEAEGRKGEVRVLPALLQILYGDKGVDVAQSIGGSVHLLTPTTARAESWLCAWKGRGNWGGERRGAGKPAAPGRIKDNNQHDQ
ncbi:hypothetical protein [Hydrogenophaga sp.]|uniref:hypothetical protein n=1 Tax=Hydrogenophaga sp. TaxID=1904254 RepID=UPI002ABB3941|nr:hypothetical protein [Hydrogenophaga sp.]MDZ4398710.1 hypothetical protein [Hydrogenophaga sp.]